MAGSWVLGARTRDQRYVLRAWMGDEVKISMGIYIVLVPFSQGNLGGSAWQLPGRNALFWGCFFAAACGAGGVGVAVEPLTGGSMSSWSVVRRTGQPGEWQLWIS
jgi:hypothetical protein